MRTRLVECDPRQNLAVIDQPTFDACMGVFAANDAVLRAAQRYQDAALVLENLLKDDGRMSPERLRTAWAALYAASEDLILMLPGGSDLRADLEDNMKGIKTWRL
jgi:hypothetical protein